MVVAAAVVVTSFDPSPHTGGDNAGYVALGYSLASGQGYTELFDPAHPPHTKYPPVFPALLAFLMLVGARTWTALKTVAAASTLAAVGLTYVWCERRRGPWGALGVSALLALASAVVYYSHWILSDPTFLALTVCALWALDRADDENASPGWLAIGTAAAGLAYFTRSAGLPLLVAILGWLALRRRWRALATVAVAIGVPALVWWLRARGAGDVQYVSEFWMVDPYQPALGTVGVGGLVGRVGANLRGYVLHHVPGGIVGTPDGAPAALLGVALVVLAGVGWWRAARERVGPVELFVPLYAGLILLWPEVWSGDRFALPLYPPLFVYAASAMGGLRERTGPVVERVASAFVLAMVLLPAVGAWTGAARGASACAAVVRASGPFACYGPRIEAFAAAADWAGRALPDGSAVLSRKPRIFFVLSGVPGRTFPFDDAVGAQISAADGAGARYVLLDQWDNLSTRYVAAAVQRDPSSFCVMRVFGDAATGASELLGIAPAGTGVPDGLARCAPDYLRSGWSEEGYAPSSSSARIPLLDGLDP